MKALYFFILITCSSVTFSQSILWANQGQGPQSTFGDGIAHDGNGNIYITGDFRDSIRFGSVKITETNLGSPYCAKFDSLGTLIWLKKDIGGDGIVFDGSSSLYAFTQFNQTLKKIDQSGTILWSKSTFTSSVFGSNGINGVYADANNVYITGNYSGNAQFDSDLLMNVTPTSGWDIFVAKFTTAGTCVWAKTAGGKGLDKGYGIYVDAANNVYNSGYYKDTATFGSTQYFSNGGIDAYVSKYDVSGNMLWNRSFGGTGFDLSNTVTGDGAGNIYTMGRFSTQIAFGTYTITGAAVNSYINKIDANGATIWAKAIAGYEEGDLSYDNNKLAFIVSSGNGLALTGYTLAPLGGTDIVLGEMNTNGNVIWAKIYGGTSNEEGSGITQYNNRVYFTGSFNTNATFDSFSFTSQQSWDVIVARINSTVVATGVDDKHYDSSVLIYPNPATENITLKIDDQTNSSISISDLFGQVVINIPAAKSMETIDISKLAAGIYYVKLANSNKISSTKFIKN